MPNGSKECEVHSTGDISIVPCGIRWIVLLTWSFRKALLILPVHRYATNGLPMAQDNRLPVFHDHTELHPPSDGWTGDTRDHGVGPTSLDEVPGAPRIVSPSELAIVEVTDDVLHDLGTGRGVDVRCGQVSESALSSYQSVLFVCCNTNAGIELRPLR
jgi:hypothetical protein